MYRGYLHFVQAFSRIWTGACAYKNVFKCCDKNESVERERRIRMEIMEDTIAAIATAVSEAGISIVRISGKQA